MISRFFFSSCCAAVLALLLAPGAARAAEPYATFTAGAQVKTGLFPIWEKDGHAYMELRPDQIDKEYLETIVPGNGLSQAPLWWGDTDYQPTEIVRFERRGGSIVMLWTNWYVRSPGNENAQRADEYGFPQSVTGIGQIVAEDANHIVFDLSALLTDEMDIKNIIDEGLAPDKSYRLDSGLSYFDGVKAFPENDVISVAQTWSTDAKHVYDLAPDARKIRIKVVYNFIQMPNDDYRPRYADDRMGVYDMIYFNFANDRTGSRLQRYLLRWNFDPQDPSRPSKARHPMVMYISDTVPAQYRAAVTDACLEWNKAFAKAGILDAVQVRMQPSDPAWDPDDFRYSVIRWLNEAYPGFGASSQTLANPLTGEEIRTGVLVSATVGFSSYNSWKYLVDPIRYGRTTDPVPAKFIHDAVFSTIVHEMGHNVGLQHNFIGSQAYSAPDLQSMAFTSRNGIASSVMEYAPINLWPRGTPQGDYSQTTLGPWDYYQIRYAYEPIPSARTPEDEIPVLHRWANGWSDPRYRYESDEDVSWNNGHAADPRTEQGDLTNDNLAWCGTMMRMYRDGMNDVPRFWPQAAHSYEEESRAFGYMFGGYLRCPNIVAHWIGGQYLSRAHRGDPGAQPPVVPVPRAQQKRAMGILAKYLFAPDVLTVPQSMLEHLSYDEWAGYSFTSWEGYGNLPAWAYNPPVRHDYDIEGRLLRAQMGAVNFILQPEVLARIDGNTLLSRDTASLTDVLGWLHEGIYGNLGARGIPLVSRNLQMAYAGRLETLANKPPAGTPADAQALARVELQRIARDAQHALHGSHDAVTAAHLQNLIHSANGALGAVQVQ